MGVPQVHVCFRFKKPGEGRGDQKLSSEEALPKSVRKLSDTQRETIAGGFDVIRFILSWFRGEGGLQ